MKSKEQNLQYFNDHLFNVEIAETKKLIPLVVQLEKICMDLANVKTVKETETIYNERTKFTNSAVSFLAYNLQDEYKQAKHIEAKLSSGKYKLSRNELTDKNELKKSFVDAVRLKHSTFFTDKQMKQKNQVEKLMNDFNNLDILVRQQIGFNRLFELKYQVYAPLRLSLIHI